MSSDGTVPALDVPGLAAMLRVLCDETRLRILLALTGGQRDVTALSASLRLPQPTISHHLTVLRGGRLLVNRRWGKHVYYRFGPCAGVIGPNAIRVECPNFALTFELRNGDGRPDDGRNDGMPFDETV